MLCLDVREDWLNWPDWFRECGLPQPPASTRRLNMNSYPLVIQAALNGQGLALGWATLIDDYLAAGTLVAPVKTALVTNSRFYMLEPSLSTRVKAGVDVFRNWLQSFVSKEITDVREDQCKP